MNNKEGQSITDEIDETDDNKSDDDNDEDKMSDDDHDDADDGSDNDDDGKMDDDNVGDESEDDDDEDKKSWYTLAKDIPCLQNVPQDVKVTDFVQKLCEKFYNFIDTDYSPIVDSDTYKAVEETVDKALQHIEDDDEKWRMAWIQRRYKIKAALRDNDDDDDNAWIKLAQSCYTNWHDGLNHDITLRTLVMAMYEKFRKREQMYNSITTSDLYNSITDDNGFDGAIDDEDEERTMQWLNRRYLIYQYIISCC
jgi:hypothetical protein